MEVAQGRPDAGRLSGADRPGRRTSRSRSSTSPRSPRAKHRAGLRRLFALQIKDALKYLEKNIPDLQKMAVAYMPLGTPDELREQIIDVALDRAFLPSRCRPTQPLRSAASRKAAAG